MDFVLESQGERLNNFRTFRVDYLDRDHHWQDFQELIWRPASGALEFADDAVEYIYDQTAGNPYFSKYLCQEIATSAKKNSDSHVTVVEAQRAVSGLQSLTAPNVFAHFWKDATPGEQGAESERITLRRRQLLNALGRLEREGQQVTEEAIVDHVVPSHMGTEEALAELKDLRRRRILLDDDGRLRARVRFFGDWLSGEGVDKLLSEAVDAQDQEELEQLENELEIAPAEILNVEERFGLYRDKTVSSDRIRDWLEQFGGIQRQRLMLRVLEEVRFYSDPAIRERLKHLGDRLLKEAEGGSGPKRRLILSTFDDPMKSGGSLARRMAEECGFSRRMTVGIDDLAKGVSGKRPVTVAFVDDLIGSGGTAASGLDQALESIPALTRKNVEVRVVALAGLASGVSKVEDRLSELGLTGDVLVADRLDEEDRLFADESRAFPDAAERLRARAVLEEVGRNLEPRAPLGHGGAQLAVVFSHSCPNNTATALWKESDDWRPLFPRHTR